MISRSICLGLGLVALILAGSANAAMVGHWFTSDGITLSSDSVGTNDLTEMGNYVETTANIPALGGVVPVLNLTGSTSYAWNSAPSAALSATTFSISAFIQVPNASQITSNNRLTARAGYNLDIETFNQGGMYASGWGTGWQTASGAYTGNWQSVVWTVDSTAKTVKEYVDGTNVFSYNFTGTITPSGAFYVGISKDLNDQGDLSIADLAYFNTALSQTQVNNIVAGGADKWNAVPEPATMLIFGIGSLLAVRRRKTS